MADRKTLNKVASDYQKSLKDPNWNINKKSAAEFSKGASKSGDLISPEVKDKAKKFFKSFTK